MSYSLQVYTPPELYVRRTEPTIHYSMDSGIADWFANGATVTDNTTDQREGTGCAQVVTAGTSAISGGRFLANVNEDWSNSSFRMYLYADNWSNVTYLGLTIYTNGGFVDFAQFNIRDQFSPAMVGGGGQWVECNFTLSEMTLNGTPNFADVTNVIFTVIDNGTPVTARADGLSIFPLGGASGGLVSHTFDDGLLTSYTEALPILESKGLKASWYPIARLVDNDANHMTAQQVENLALTGHEIGMHGEFDLTGLSNIALENDLHSSREFSVNNGYGYGMAYPLGGFTEATIKAVRKQCSYGMNVSWMHNNPNALSQWHINRFSPSAATTQLTITDHIDECQTNNDWLIINWHGFNAAPTGVETTPAIFQNVLDHIEAAGIRTLPVGNVLRGDTL